MRRGQRTSEKQRGRRVASSRSIVPAVRVCAVSIIFAAAAALPVALPSPPLEYRGRIPAARLAATIIAANLAREHGQHQSGSAGNLKDATRGGSSFRTTVGVNLRYEIFTGTPDEAWKKLATAFQKILLSAHRTLHVALNFAEQLLLAALTRALWLGLGVKVPALQMAKPTWDSVWAEIATSASAPTGRLLVHSSSGPVRELIGSIKSAGSALANVEMDFSAACWHSALEVAALAFGRRPPGHAGIPAVARGVGRCVVEEGDEEVEEGDDEDESRWGEHESAQVRVDTRREQERAQVRVDTRHGRAGAGAGGEVGGGMRVTERVATPTQRVFLSNASNGAEVREPSPIKVHPHGLHNPTSLCEFRAAFGNDSAAEHPKVKVPVRVRLPAACTSASVVGSWNAWGQRHDLALQSEAETRLMAAETSSDAREFVGLLELPPGRYQCKFIVDGVWQIHEGWPTETDSRGILNNVLEVPRQRSASADRMHQLAPTAGAHQQALKEAADEEATLQMPAAAARACRPSGSFSTATSNAADFSARVPDTGDGEEEVGASDASDASDALLSSPSWLPGPRSSRYALRPEGAVPSPHATSPLASSPHQEREQDHWSDTIQ